MLTWLKQKLGLADPRVELIPWTDAHSGNFDDDEEAYTLVVDGDVTNISFAIDVSDPRAPNYKKVDMTIPNFVAQYGVEIEPSVLEQYENEQAEEVEQTA